MKPLAEVLKDEDTPVPVAAMRSLIALKDAGSVDVLIPLLKDKSLKIWVPASSDDSGTRRQFHR